MEKENCTIQLEWCKIKSYDDRIVVYRSDSGEEREYATIYKRKQCKANQALLFFNWAEAMKIKLTRFPQVSLSALLRNPVP